MRTILIILVGLVFSLASYAQSLDKAENAYSAGNYAEAAHLYLERAIEKAGSSANASLYHNLGLAYDREKELGLAIASYLRAVQLEPRQGDFQYNLQFLLEQTKDKLDNNFPQSILTRIWAGPGMFLTEREVFYASLIFFILFSVFLSFGLLKPQMRKGSRILSLLSLLVFLSLTSALSYKLWGQPDLGAVTASSVNAYSGPTESIVIFELHQGAPFQILNVSGDWVKIQLSDQKQGWVKKEGIASFGRDLVLVPTNGVVKS